ncbi:tyrosine-type recombinase/integrase [Kribbella sp. NPDC004875]|uniref:tyrosine-type recombinase/integrase n=1 Tax=Kribbella sp. NPDC004875 TaxID=3364107 RepID=UPI0036A2B9F9
MTSGLRRAWQYIACMCDRLTMPEAVHDVYSSDHTGGSGLRPDGRPIDPRKDWDDWKDLLAVADVRDARVHDGRHTAATVLIELGVHVRIVQEILDHSDIRLTQRYTHVASPMAADAAQQMGRALWGGTP